MKQGLAVPWDKYSDNILFCSCHVHSLPGLSPTITPLKLLRDSNIFGTNLFKLSQIASLLFWQVLSLFSVWQHNQAFDNTIKIKFRVVTIYFGCTKCTSKVTKHNLVKLSTCTTRGKYKGRWFFTWMMTDQTKMFRKFAAGVGQGGNRNVSQIQSQGCIWLCF